MRFGIFSDVHANQEALNAVVDALNSEHVDAYVFLGDIVGYGADPKECIAVLRSLSNEKTCVCIAGNHDHAVCGKTTVENFNMHARIAVEWQREQLDHNDLSWLSELELVKSFDLFTIAHSSLVDPAQWGYVLNNDDASLNFQVLEKRVCFIGHSHKPVIFSSRGGDAHIASDVLMIDETAKYIVNVGSVGQPRDGDPRASYAVFDSDEKLIAIKRVEYDVLATQQKIVDAGLPKILAERLSHGK